LKIIIAVDKSNPIISLQLYIRTGSVHESEKNSGYSHFIEHLVFKNTDDFPNNQISNRVPLLGGLINAYTEFDSTCYYLMLPREEIKSGLEILANIAYRSVFNEQDIDVEKDIIIEEIKQYANDPESSFIDWIQESYFVSNALKNPILGTVETVKKASLESLKNFYLDNYRPDNSFLVIAGDFNNDKVEDYIDLYFSDWRCNKHKMSKKNSVIIPEKNGFRYFSKDNYKKGDYLAIVVPELQESDILNDALLITEKAFASGKQSRLYKRLVEKDKSAIEIKLHSISGLNPGITIIQILPQSAELVPDIIYAFYDEWMNTKHNFFPDADIELLKKEMIYSWLYDFEYIESIASSLGNEEIIDSYKNLYKFPDKIAQIDSKKLTDCINTYWNMDYLAIYYQGKKLLSRDISNNLKKLFVENRFIDKCVYPDISKIPNLDLNNLKVDSKIKINITDSEFKEVYLDCGMHMLIRRVFNKPTIGMSLTNPVSQLNESPEQKGFNYFTSNLLLFGTKDKTYDDIQKECLNNGYSFKINHTLESTTLKGKCFTFNLDSMLILASEMLQYPSFPLRHLNKIKTAVIDNLRREKHTPFNVAYENWGKLFLGNETNLLKPFNNITNTKQIKLDQLQEWYNCKYILNDYTLCITGDVDFNRVEDLCNKIFTKGYSQQTKSVQNYFYNSSNQKMKIKNNVSDQSNIILGGYSCSASDYESTTAFYVLSQILGGDISSRLFNILREKYGYTYQTGFDFTSIRKLGFWLAYAICDKEDYKAVYDLMLGILEDVVHLGVTDDEIISAKNYLIGMHRFEMESLSWQASTLSILYALGYDYEYFMNREKRLNSVDLCTVNQVAKNWLTHDNIYSYIES